MTFSPFRFPALVVRAAAACAAAFTLASCGGGVSANPSPVVDSPSVTILPAAAVMYPGLPTTFVLSGGTGAYIVASSNQAILPISGGVTGRSVTLVPNPVLAETMVTLTVRDTGSATPVSATVTVKPGTVNNDLTVSPSSTQDPSCSPAVCSGGDAEVKVTVSQGGIPLAARGMRFQVVNGSYAFLETPPLSRFETAGVPTSLITATDETGTARARIRVTALAPSQTATVRVTDVVSGAFREASFAIAQFTGNTPAFFTLPSSITFTGPYADLCASGSTASAEVSVYGGTPPYAISGGSGAFFVSPTTVAANGGRFSVTLFPLSSVGTPVCFEGASVGVTDATGRTIAVTVSNEPGTGTAPAPAIALVPTTLGTAPAPLGCGASASIIVTGGGESATFNVSSNHPGVLAAVETDAGRTITVTRITPDVPPGPYPATALITVTDGTTSRQATVHVVPSC